jgi:hypothetical protein
MSQQDKTPGQWFSTKNGITSNPLTWEQVVDQVRGGELSATDMLHGPSGWVPAGTISQLEGQFSAASQSENDVRDSNMAPPLSQEPKRRRFRITGCLVMDITLLVIVISIACLGVTIGGVTLFQPDAKDLVNDFQQSVSEAFPGLPQIFPGPPLPDPELLGTLTVDSSGGLFDNGEIGIQAAENSLSEAEEFLVYSLENQGEYEDGEFYRSSYYLLEGPLSMLNGEINISLPFPAEAQVVPSEYDGVETAVYVFLEEPSYGRDTGFTLGRRMLASEVDWNAGRVIATISPSIQPLVGRQQVGLASPERQRELQQSPQLDERAAVTISYGAVYNYYTSEHFQLAFRDFPEAQTNGEAASDLLKMLEFQRGQLETVLGYDFSGIEQTTVYLDNFVTLRSTWNDLVYGEEPPHKWGMQTPSSVDENDSTLSFNKRYFYDYEYFQMYQQELQSTAGHELFHAVQFTYDPRFAYFKAKDPLPALWFDEAAAVWYESYAIDPQNGSYLSPVAVENSGFIYTPLLTPPKEGKAAQNHGYGASIFLRYLTNKYDSALVRSTYERYAADPYSGMISEAFTEALMDYDSSPGVEWPSFLEAYYTQPDSIIAGLPGPTETNTAVLNAVVDENRGETQISFQPNSSLQVFQPVENVGSLEQMTLPSLEVTFPLQDMTAESLNITFDSSADSQAIFAHRGTMLIEVTAPEGSGVLVYGRQQRGATVTTIASAPWNYLSSGDTNSEIGAQAAVDFDLTSSDGSHANLLLIPFNSHSTTYTDLPPAKQIIVNLTYISEASPASSGEIICPATIHINCWTHDASFDLPMELTTYRDGGILNGTAAGQTVCPGVTGSPEDPVPADFSITSDYTIVVTGYYDGGENGEVSGEADIVEEYYWPITDEMVQKPILSTVAGKLSPDCTGEGTIGEAHWYAP